jgi:ribosome maturation factor RimP
VKITLKSPSRAASTGKARWACLGGEPGRWTLCVFHEGKAEQVLGFALDEVREARLVPVVDFKGRGPPPVADDAPAAPEEAAAFDGGQDR